MAGRFQLKKLFFLLASLGCVSQSVMAAAFQVGEQDGASVGNDHAGRAAIAEDASTAFYNPAGLTKIHNQQLVLSLDPIATNTVFRGTVNVATQGIGSTGPIASSAQGGGMNMVPALHYAAPLSDKWVLALSVFSPFNAETDYGTNSFTRYASTLSSIRVIDYSPALAYAVTSKLSLGAGFDIQRANVQFNWAGGNQLFSTPAGVDTYGQNTASDHAYGYHLGALYEFTPSTRVGLAYQSKVVHIMRGTSLFYGPLANNGNTTGGSVQNSDYFNTKVVLPPTTTFSLFHTFNSAWDAMGTLSYTRWDVMNQLSFNNVAGAVAGSTPGTVVSSNSITVTLPEHYRNTWNIAAGANYHINDRWMLRTGLGYDQTPSDNETKNLQFPDGGRLAAAVGAHFQATNALALDAGWMHVFGMNTHVNSTTVIGAQSATAVGTSQFSADVYGLQITWNFL